MARDHIENLQNQLSKSRIKLQSLSKNLALIKQENTNLKKRLKRSSFIYNSIPAGVCLIQKERLVEMNQTILAMLGYEADEIIGHYYSDIIHPGHLVTMKEHLGNWSSRKMIPELFEIRLITKNKEALSCDLRVDKIKLQGRTTFIVFIANSEERKRREKEGLTSRKNIALITLSSGVAGRLSQCLPSLNTGVDRLREYLEIKDGRIEEPLLKIEDAALYIQRMIQQLNRLNSRPHPPERLVPLSINDLMQTAISIVKSRLELSTPPYLENISLRTFYRSKSIAVINPEEIQEAFMHLIMNACEATQERGDIFISTEEYNGFVHIYIQDNGIGIPEEMMDRIFDPFYTSRGQHSGLGLSIAHAIIKRHNGFIEVTSLEDRGTTFHIGLPLAGTVSSPSYETKKNRKLRDSRLLIIHHNPLIRELISQLFVEKGCKVMNAESGTEGLNCIHKTHFDLLLADTQNLGMDPNLLVSLYKKRNHASPTALILPGEVIDENIPVSDPETDLIIHQPIDLDCMVKDISSLLKNGIVHRK